MSDLLGGQPNNGFYDTSEDIEKMEDDLRELKIMTGSLGLSLVGMVTGFGEAADVANALLFYSTNHPILGTLSAMSAVPIAGWEHVCGAALGTCLLAKVIYAGAKVIKSAFIIISKQKFLKPVYIYFQKSKQMFMSVFEGNRVILTQVKAETQAIQSSAKISSNKSNISLLNLTARSESCPKILDLQFDLENKVNTIFHVDSSYGSRSLKYISAERYNQLCQHFQKIYSLGVKKMNELIDFIKKWVSSAKNVCNNGFKYSPKKTYVGTSQMNVNSGFINSIWTVDGSPKILDLSKKLESFTGKNLYDARNEMWKSYLLHLIKIFRPW